MLKEGEDDRKFVVQAEGSLGSENAERLPDEEV